MMMSFSSFSFMPGGLFCYVACARTRTKVVCVRLVWGYLLVLGKTEGVVAAVERNELGLEEDVTVDGQVGVAARLNTAEASC